MYKLYKSLMIVILFLMMLSVNSFAKSYPKVENIDSSEFLNKKKMRSTFKFKLKQRI